MKYSRTLTRISPLLFLLCLLMVMVSACSNNLSRGKAEKMIRTKISPFSVRFVDAGLWGGLVNDGILSDVQVKQLRKDGYLLANRFTEKAKPFLIVKGSNFYLQIGTVDKVIVSSISAPADMMGQRVCQAQYEVIYKPNEVGKKLNIELNKLKRSDQAIFILTDNGWELSDA